MMAHGVAAAPLCYSEDTTAFDARSGTFDTTTGTHRHPAGASTTTTEGGAPSAARARHSTPP